jgi:hypothetical protein
MILTDDQQMTGTTADPELLIEEARQRQQRRQQHRMIALVATGILAVLGLVAYRTVHGGNAASAQEPRPILTVARQRAVIYEKVETVVIAPHLPTIRRTGEVWFSTAAPFTYRELLTIAGGPSVEVGAGPGHDPKIGNEVLVYLYDATANTIYKTGAFLTPPTAPPRLRQQFERFLAQPGVRLDGTRLLDGHKVFVARGHAPLFGGPASETVTAYVDTVSYQPLLIINSGPGLTWTTRILAYKTLPATATNLRLTSLAGTHPGARSRPASARVDTLYGEASQIATTIGSYGSDLGPVAPG